MRNTKQKTLQGIRPPFSLKLKECIEIIDELQAHGITYTILKYAQVQHGTHRGHRPRRCMLGQHPKFEEIAKFEAEAITTVKKN